MLGHVAPPDSYRYCELTPLGLYEPTLTAGGVCGIVLAEACNERCGRMDVQRAICAPEVIPDRIFRNAQHARNRFDLQPRHEASDDVAFTGRQSIGRTLGVNILWSTRRRQVLALLFPLLSTGM